MKLLDCIRKVGGFTKDEKVELLAGHKIAVMSGKNEQDANEAVVQRYLDDAIAAREEIEQAIAKKMRPENVSHETSPQPAVDNRRISNRHRAAIDEMTPAEKDAEIARLRAENTELLVNPVSGLPGRAAFNEAMKTNPTIPQFAAIDMDGLKYINDEFGHEAGDQYLAALGIALKDANLDAYHLGGDEFAVISWGEQIDLIDALETVQAEMEQLSFNFTGKSGKQYLKNGAEFSFATGKDYKNADKRVAVVKESRTRQGKRAERGQPPRGLVEQPAGTNDEGGSVFAARITGASRGQTKGTPGVVNLRAKMTMPSGIREDNDYWRPGVKESAMLQEAADILATGGWTSKWMDGVRALFMHNNVVRGKEMAKGRFISTTPDDTKIVRAVTISSDVTDTQQAARIIAHEAAHAADFNDEARTFASQHSSRFRMEKNEYGMFDPVGDIITEAMSAYEDALNALSRDFLKVTVQEKDDAYVTLNFLSYPFEYASAHASFYQREVFAQMAAMYYTNSSVMQRVMPIAFKTMEHIHEITTATNDRTERGVHEAIRTALGVRNLVRPASVGQDVGSLNIEHKGFDAAWLGYGHRAGTSIDRASELNPNVIFEVAPDPNNKELSARWNSLPIGRRRQISEDISNALIPDFLKSIGAVGRIDRRVGSYLNDTNTAFSVSLQEGDPLSVAKALGYGLSQDSMMVVSIEPFEGSEAVGVVSVNIGNSTAQQVEGIYNQLREIEVDGEQPVGGQTYANDKMVILNYSNVATKELAAMIEAKLDGKHGEVTHGEAHAAFLTQEEYGYGKGNDQGGTQGSIGRGSPSDSRQATGLREKASAAIESALAGISVEPAIATTKGEFQDTGSIRGSVGVLAESRRAYQGNEGTSLKGLPRIVEVDGKSVEFGGFAPAQKAARDYMKSIGLPYNPPTDYVKVDKARSTRIAGAFEAMRHDPNNSKVKASYAAMIKETLAQYEAILKTGLKIEFNQNGVDPYINPRNAILDVVENNHLFIFPTSEGHGSSDAQIKDNPLLAPTKYKFNGQPTVANDIFRVVHDYFGHIKEGNGFRADGEENAWRLHAAMYSQLARGAMTSETRGQNSWVNFGPYGEQNRTASGADTHYADQKVGLLPEWAMRDDYEADSGVAGVLEMRERTSGDERFGGISVKQGAEQIAAMDADERDNMDIYDAPGGYHAYRYYEAKKMMPTPSDKLKRVTDRNSDTLSQDADYIANVDGELYGITKQEDPDAEDDESKFVFTAERMDSRNSDHIDTMTDDVAELFAEIRKHNWNAITKDDLSKAVEYGPAKASRVGKISPAIAILEKTSPKESRTVDWVAHMFDAMLPERDFKNPDDRRAAMRQAVVEYEYQMAQNTSGEDWYEKDIRLALDITAKVVPYLKEGRQPMLFTLVAGIHSQGTSVKDNWREATINYQHYLKEEEFSEVNPTNDARWATASGINKGRHIAALNNMIRDLGEDGVLDWMYTEHPVAELNQYRLQYGGLTEPIYGKRTDMKMGVAMFGPKVSIFIKNLNGIDGVTVDKWLTRTFNRWYGKMVGKDDAIIDAPSEPVRRAVTSMIEEIAALYNVTQRSVQAALWYFEQDLFKHLNAGERAHGFSDAAKSVYEDNTGKRYESGVTSRSSRGGVSEAARGGADEVANNRGVEEETFSKEDLAIAQEYNDGTPNPHEAGRGFNNLNNNTKSTLGAVKDFANNNSRDALPMALQLLGRRQIADIYGKLLPSLNDYSKEMQLMDAEKSGSAHDADKIVQRWDKLKPEVADRLADIMHDATLAQYDPDSIKNTNLGKMKTDAQKANAAKIRTAWINLPDEAKQIYRDARDMYKKQWADVEEAIIQRIQRAVVQEKDRKAMIDELRLKFQQQLTGVYFPLARFGDYFITVKKPGQDENVAVVFAESTAEAKRMREQLVTEYAGTENVVSPIQAKAKFNGSQSGPNKEFIGKLFSMIESQRTNDDISNVAADSMIDSINQLYLTNLPDLSWAKHALHRKGIAGYSKDARRAFAQNIFHGGFHLARINHADILQDHIDAMRTQIADNRNDPRFDAVKAQRVLDEMVMRHQKTLQTDNNPIASFLTGLGFIWHMGLSPASAIVNLSQTPLIALPMMSAQYGATKSSAALLRAFREAAVGMNDMGKNLQGDEKAAYDKAVREGIIDLTLAHNLAGVAQGQDNQLNKTLTPVMKAASWMFHQTELFNRQTTFMATYRLAKGTGMSSEAAYDAATGLTYDSHFDYSASNRPRAMMGPVQRVLFLFKQYGQNVAYTIARNAYVALQGATPEERKVAFKTLSGMMVMTGLTTGAFGLPFAVSGAWFAAASALGSDKDEPWDAKVALRNYLADAVGPDIAEMMVHGVTRKLFPGDISGRVGLDTLFFSDGGPALEGAQWYNSMAETMLGPVAGIGLNITKGAADVSSGEVLRGIAGMLPISIANPLKALRFAQEGVKDKTGVQILDDLTFPELATQAVGFSPNRVKEAYEGRQAIYSVDKAVMLRRKELLRDFAKASINGDDTDKIRDEIIAFSEKQPQAKIDGNSLRSAIKDRIMRVEQADNGVYLPKKRRGLAELGEFANTE